MNEELYKLSEVAKMFDCSYNQVLIMIDSLKIKPIKQGTKKLSKSQITRLKTYTPKGKDIRKYKKYSNKKINVIDFYLTHPNNNAHLIAIKLSLDYRFVSDTISEWLENNRTITVVSKL